MNHASFRKPGRRLLIGLLASLVPLAAAHAADSEQWRQDQIDPSPPAMPVERPDSEAMPGQYDRERTPDPDTRGMRGPIRSDPSEHTPEQTRELQRQQELDSQMNRQLDDSRTIPAQPPQPPTQPLP
ncbi:MAG TPA: hypothetical protein VF096_13145 [Azonexus sp.]